jgi:uncharacterized protein YuzB (UPF0349 family)
MKKQTIIACLSAMLLQASVSTAMADKTVYLPTNIRGGADGTYSATAEVTDTTVTWCKARSKESDNFIVFWQAGFGADPNKKTWTGSVPKVDVDDLLEHLEAYYDLYINKLKFAEVGKGVSKLDKYKMVILLYFTTDWMAYGSGFDDTIGGMWISPSTCQPVGSTIAHECGHSFQYQCYCDLGGYAGFRYSTGQGSTFWEQTAEWQSFMNFPAERFNDHMPLYQERYNLAFTHEWMRYQSTYLHHYFVAKHGEDIIGRIWRGATSEQDPCEVYMSLMQQDDPAYTVEDFYTEMYDAAARAATFDLDNIREYGKSWIGKHQYNYVDVGDGKLQVAYKSCPQVTGYNLIPLSVPAGGTKIACYFTPLAPHAYLADGDPGITNNYSELDASKKKSVTRYNSFTGGAGSRVGFCTGYVALLKDGTRVYSDMRRLRNDGTSVVNVADTTYFTVPANTEKLWYVVSPAPYNNNTKKGVYFVHKWDDDDGVADDQWPYQVEFSNTDVTGHVKIDADATPQDADIDIYVNLTPSSSSYEGVTYYLSEKDLETLGQAFVMQPSSIADRMVSYNSAGPGEGKVMLLALKPNGLINNIAYTTNGIGYWFGGSASTTSTIAKLPAGSYSNDPRVFVEFSASNLAFGIGQMPGVLKKHQRYLVRECLRYCYDAVNKKYARVNFNFHVSVGDTKGDANADGSVTVADITSVADLILDPSNTAVHHWASDVNEDDEISVSDITEIANTILGDK